MPFLLTEDPTTVNDLSPRFVIGGLYKYHHPSYGWGLYRYFQALDAVTYVQGHTLEHASATGLGVSNDRASGSSIGRVPAGVAQKVFTQNYYGFVQVSGIGATLLSSAGNIAASKYLVSDTTDGLVDDMADGEEEQVFAMSAAADGASGFAAGAWIFKGLL